MKKLGFRVAFIFAFITTTSVLYQNCSKQFILDGKQEATNGNADLGSSAGGPSGDHQAPHITPISAKIEANADIEFSVHTESLLPSASYLWSHTLNGVPTACALKNGDKATNYIINCRQPGTLSVSVVVTEGNVPTSVPPVSVVLPALPANAVEINLQVDFTIPAGTGSNPWNTMATAVETFVGQTLKITNMDSITHQYHTNGRPCGHGSAMAAGGTTNCVITRAYDYRTDGVLYDHNLGTRAAFYVVAHDGAALYARNCANCHGALTMSQKAGAKVSAIKNALATVPTMSSNAALTGLTQRQIEAISFALGGK